MQLLNISTMNVKVPVSASQLPGTITNPTIWPVYMYFSSSGEPALPAAPGGGAGWNVASWQTANNTYYAVCLTGPELGAIDLTPGAYSIYVQVGDSSTPANGEVPVLQGGTLNIT